MVTCGPLILCCMCMLDGADCDGACYDLDDEIKKEVKPTKGPLPEAPGGSSDPTWQDGADADDAADGAGIGGIEDAHGGDDDGVRPGHLRV